ncbi:hypothetical protein, partial [Rhodovulum sulfidophilum]|uniref:hypothetical protein n=1 Tax=Rhodovulum sulfidophilum TaxID=35806 RepID=UPI001F3D9EE4
MKAGADNGRVGFLCPRPVRSSRGVEARPGWPCCGAPGTDEGLPALEERQSRPVDPTNPAPMTAAQE